MRHALVRLTGLLIALMLVLTGCNLIGIDPMMQLNEDFDALNKKYSGVVASYDGGEIKQADVMASFTSQYSYMSQLYSMYGMNMSSDMLVDIQESVVENAVQGVAIARQMEARGLKLDDEKLAEVQAEADEHYQEAMDSALENAEGENEEVRNRRAEYNLAVNGFTKDALYQMELAIANEELIEQTLRDEITEVTDEQLQTAYDDKVADDEEKFADSASSFESAMSSDDEVVCWMPEGYRTVKHILLVPGEEPMSAVTTARNAVTSAQSKLDSLQAELDALDEADDAEADDAEAETTETEAAEPAETAEPARTAEDIQADIAAAEEELKTAQADADKAAVDCIASVQDKLDEIYAKIEAGEDFDALIEEYGEDPGMKNEPTKTRGYYVSANSAKWDKNFTAGAMALEKVGDVSETPAVSSSGVHIIRYESDVTPGAVPFEDVKEALYEDTLEEMKADHYSVELQSWIDALNPKYTIENFDLTA